mmetsp:Transcript_3956/g.10681  ORF Transcript_3956/g.10681 Transcript_3956/m.10681 type:complete len:415 (+) Transcript_3956:1963-3207(+)
MEHLAAEVGQLHRLVEGHARHGEGGRHHARVRGVDAVHVLPHRDAARVQELGEERGRVVRAAALQRRRAAGLRAAHEARDDQEGRLLLLRVPEGLRPPLPHEVRGHVPDGVDGVDRHALLAEAAGGGVRHDQDVARVHPRGLHAGEVHVGVERLRGPDLAQAGDELDHLGRDAAHQRDGGQHGLHARLVVVQVGDDGVRQVRAAGAELQEDAHLPVDGGAEQLHRLGLARHAGVDDGDESVRHAADCGDDGRRRRALGAAPGRLRLQEVAADHEKIGVVQRGASKLVDLPLRAEVVPIAAEVHSRSIRSAGVHDDLVALRADRLGRCPGLGADASADHSGGRHDAMAGDALAAPDGRPSEGGLLRGQQLCRLGELGRSRHLAADRDEPRGAHRGELRRAAAGRNGSPGQAPVGT